MWEFINTLRRQSVTEVNWRWLKNLQLINIALFLASSSLVLVTSGCSRDGRITHDHCMHWNSLFYCFLFIWTIRLFIAYFGSCTRINRSFWIVVIFFLMLLNVFFFQGIRINKARNITICYSKKKNYFSHTVL